MNIIRGRGSQKYGRTLEIIRLSPPAGRYPV
jgi:hypothetical protein